MLSTLLRMSVYHTYICLSSIWQAWLIGPEWGENYFQIGIQICFYLYTLLSPDFFSQLVIMDLPKWLKISYTIYKTVQKTIRNKNQTSFKKVLYQRLETNQNVSLKAAIIFDLWQIFVETFWRCVICIPYCLKVSNFQKQIFLFWFEPKNEWYYSLNSALASKMSQIKKMKGVFITIEALFFFIWPILDP